MFGVRSGFACVGCASFKPFWPLAFVQQAQAALVFVVCGLCGHCRFCALGLTRRSSRPAYCGRLILFVRKLKKEEIIVSDAVSTAFDMLLEEIEGVEDDFKDQLTEYARAGDLDRAESKLKTIRALKPFIEKLTALRIEWQNGLLDETKPSFNKIEHIDIPPRRAPRTALVVKFSNGNVIKESTAAETFSRVLKEIGIERVAKLGKAVNGWPLITPKKHPTYTQQKVNGEYIMTHTSTSAKKALLEEISQELKVELDISIAV